MNKSLKYIGLGLIMVLLVGVIFWGATIVSENDSLKLLIEKFGFLGIVSLSLISNLNLVVPIHVATFTPIFIAAGFGMPIIILALAIGTTIADLLSYVLGYFGKSTMLERYPKAHLKIDYFLRNRKKYVLPGIFLYSAFVPLPNELVMLPLGLMGFKLKRILIPLLLGTMVNQMVFVYGFASVFNLLF